GRTSRGCRRHGWMGRWNFLWQPWRNRHRLRWRLSVRCTWLRWQQGCDGQWLGPWGVLLSMKGRSLPETLQMCTAKEDGEGNRHPCQGPVRYFRTGPGAEPADVNRPRSVPATSGDEPAQVSSSGGIVPPCWASFCI